MKVSVIIVTRNRSNNLHKTLRSLELLQVRDGFEVEIMVVDNGSTDETAFVIHSAAKTNPAVRYTFESRCGKTVGQNHGVKTTSGDIVLFTDDDVRPPEDWLIEMCEPIHTGKCKVVCGGVKLAENLLRPWMTPLHRSWLASSEWLTPGSPQSLVGANMGFSRSVLNDVPSFDPELGPGARGFSDDHLFALQLLAAGYDLHDMTHLCVDHHFDPSRLTRKAWLAAAEDHGASRAYVGHHWEHWGCRLTRLRLQKSLLELSIWRLSHPEQMASEGCCETELQLVSQCSTLRHHLEERFKVPNYDYHGLIKCNHETILPVYDPCN
jgi:glycosyltransferase involved in cell wall biosynthesis